MTNKTSFVMSIMDVLLRQQGRISDADSCGISVCFQNVEGATGILNVDAAVRPDCCFAAKLRVPSVTSGAVFRYSDRLARVFGPSGTARQTSSQKDHESVAGLLG
eukprot:1196177-Prorocentrum_minimum.AAC.3